MRMTTIAVVAVVGLLTMQAAAGWTQQKKLTADPDAGNSDWFGNSVSISGDYAIIGARRNDDDGNSSGSAYIFKRDGTTWTQQAKLTASDAAATDYFGCSVSISGDYAIIGANYDDDGGNASGSAYIFKRSGTIWTQQAKLTASDAATSDYFGGSVSISGNYAVIGADHTNGAGNDSGSAYIFKKPDLGWTNMTETAKLTASDAASGDFFGKSVSISGGYVVVGAYNDDHGSIDDSGSAYIFKKPDSGGWVTATQTAKLTASDAASDDDFGYSVSISGDCALVGAYSHGDGGSAYIFEKPDLGWTDTTQTAKLTASDKATGDCFGISVSIDDDSVVVGAYKDDDDGTSSGSAYIFEEPVSGWANMTQTVKLTASDAETGDEFGYSVSIDDGSALVGAYKEDHAGTGGGEYDRGSAYVYTPEPATMSLMLMGAVAILRRRRKK